MEVSLLGLSDPVSPFGSLKTVSGPIPGILRLNDVELAIEAKSHDIVSNVGSGSVHDHGVKTVKSHDSEEVTRLNKIGVNGNILNLTLNEIDSSLFAEELNVGLFHIGGHMRSDNRQVWFIAETSKESFHCVEKRL